jgi:probable rRNA maturation factor
MPDGPSVDVTVNVEVDEPAADVDLLRSAVLRTVAGHEGGGEVSLTLVDDDAIRSINREYLGKDRATDVIAFSLGEGGRLLGDVYVGVEQALRQAAELRVDPAEELVRLAVHGTLHVLGHDHPDGRDRSLSPMFELQERLVREILAG